MWFKRQTSLPLSNPDMCFCRTQFNFSVVIQRSIWSGISIFSPIKPCIISSLTTTTTIPICINNKLLTFFKTKTFTIRANKIFKGYLHKKSEQPHSMYTSPPHPLTFLLSRKLFLLRSLPVSDPSAPAHVHQSVLLQSSPCCPLFALWL